jgi:hypothetical protein
MKNALHRIKDDKAFRYRVEKWFWVAMVLPTLIWWHNSVLWVALLSIYALILSAAAAEEASEAAKKQ